MARAAVEPPDGIHAAYLARAALVETSKGDSLVTEWQSVGDNPYYWTSWFSFEGSRITFTQEFLESVGIRYTDITDDDAMEAALASVDRQPLSGAHTSRGGVGQHLRRRPAARPAAAAQRAGRAD